ncbi:MAG: dihydroxyacetone kinase subunit L [Bacteroidetes bacterium]|jgi:dihydroxyacetone kinase-like protein|nr:dihydroxyacetone kinase subunit L [Bacteroidota bacterium]
MSRTLDDVLAWLRAYADKIAEEKQYLTKLDSAIGDADHGVNMNRGFQAAMEALDDKAPASIDKALNTVAMTLISKTGGASGPLYGTFFMRAGSAVKGQETIDVSDWASMMDAGLQGVIQRGKAEVGDKTMVDALTPAVEALQQAAEDGDDWGDALAAAAEAAHDGMEATIPLIAKKGRASYLGERSKGHQDPGATSSYYLMETAAAALGG